MNSLGIWIAVAAIAVATQVAANTKLQLACGYVRGTWSFEIAQQDISKSNWIDETQKKALIEAWDNIYHDKDCSDKSWEHMSNISWCLNYNKNMGGLAFPLEKYVKKCFNFNDLEQRIKSAFESSRVDFIDSKFIERYHKDHPAALVVDETKWYVSAFCCDWYHSTGALTDAIQRNLAEEGKDPKKFFVNPNDVSGYLKEKLFQPCDDLIQSFGPLYLSTILIKNYDVARNKQEWMSSAYQPSLSQEANEALFHYRYCSDSKLKRIKIVEEALKKFLPKKEISGFELSMIKKDCLVPGYGEYIFKE